MYGPHIKRSIRRSFELLRYAKISGSLSQTFELMNWVLGRLPKDPRKRLEKIERLRRTAYSQRPWRLSPASK